LCFKQHGKMIFSVRFWMNSSPPKSWYFCWRKL
jgi:hypothetical protein